MMASMNLDRRADSKGDIASSSGHLAATRGDVSVADLDCSAFSPMFHEDEQTLLARPSPGRMHL